MKNALVTGASRGIGLAISKKLHSLDFKVHGIARGFKNTQGEDLFSSTHSIDLSDLGTLDKQISLVLQRIGELNAVVFNAGVGRFGSLEQFSFSDIDNLLSVNLTSQIYLSRILVPKLRKQGFGRLIFIGSQASYEAGRNGAVYCASKFGLRGFVLALRQSLARSGIQVTLVNPGMTQTDFYANTNFEPGSETSQHLKTETIADVIEMLLTVPSSSVVDEINLTPANHVIHFKK